MRCPRCSSLSDELIECEVCKTIGCVKCIVRHNKQWVCDKCKSGVYTQDNVAAAVSSLFG